MKSGKRNWYVAVADMSGEYEGNPPSFEAAAIYGPYTEAQAFEAQRAGEDFPHASFDVTAFCADTRPPFRSLMKMIAGMVAEAKDDAAKSKHEMDLAIAAR